MSTRIMHIEETKMMTQRKLNQGSHNTVTIGTMLAAAILNLKMADPVSLSTQLPPDVIMMENAIGNFACSHIKLRIRVF